MHIGCIGVHGMVNDDAGCQRSNEQERAGGVEATPRCCLVPTSGSFTGVNDGCFSVSSGERW